MKSKILLESVTKVSKTNERSFNELSGPIIFAISCKEQAKGFLTYLNKIYKI